MRHDEKGCDIAPPEARMRSKQSENDELLTLREAWEAAPQEPVGD
jgi:hypothetical protein